MCVCGHRLETRVHVGIVLLNHPYVMPCSHTYLKPFVVLEKDAFGSLVLIEKTVILIFDPEVRLFYCLHRSFMMVPLLRDVITVIVHFHKGVLPLLFIYDTILLIIYIILYYL